MVLLVVAVTAAKMRLLHLQLMALFGWDDCVCARERVVRVRGVV